MHYEFNEKHVLVASVQLATGEGKKKKKVHFCWKSLTTQGEAPVSTIWTYLRVGSGQRTTHLRTCRMGPLIASRRLIFQLTMLRPASSPRGLGLLPAPSTKLTISGFLKQLVTSKGGDANHLKDFPKSPATPPALVLPGARPQHRKLQHKNLQPCCFFYRRKDS